MGPGLCGPGPFGYAVAVAFFLVAGVLAGKAAGRAALRRGAGLSPPSAAGFLLGCVAPLALGVAASAGFALLFTGCEDWAWGLVPRGVLLGVLVVPPAGFAAYLATLRRTPPE